MSKVLVIALLVVVTYRLLLGRWPWEKRPTAHDRAVAKARETLGLKRRADRAEILAAHRRTLAVVHPDRGGTTAQFHAANEARDLLLADLPAAPLSDQ